MNTEKTEYLLNMIDAFNRLRDESTVFTNQATDFLEKHLNMPCEIVSIKKRLLTLLFQKMKKIVNSIINLGLFLKHGYYYYKQIVKLQNLKKLERDVLFSVIGFSSTRLFSKNIHSKMRDYFLYLFRDFLNGKQCEDLEGFFSEQNFLILHESEMHSLFRYKSRNCLQENILIFDSNFLIFTIIWMILHGKVKDLFYSFLQLPKDRKNKQLLIACMFISVCDYLFSSAKKIKSAFITSNNFFTEILRFYLLTEDRSSKVYEVMHGVPTIFYEQYIARLIYSGSNFRAQEKHNSIAQLPDLPMFGILKQDVIPDVKTAINCYLNQYVLEACRKNGSLEKYIITEVEKNISPKIKRQDPFVVSFIGASFPDGSPNRPLYSDSNYFKVEKEIIYYIKKLLEREGKNYIIIYTPHPTNKIKLFYKDPIFLEPNVVLHSNTVLTWFLADIAFTILSSALFEAAYFGIRGFMLSGLTQNVYPKELLNTLSYGASSLIFNNDSDLFMKIEKFVIENLFLSTYPLKNKIKDRLNCFYHEIPSPLYEGEQLLDQLLDDVLNTSI